MSTCIWFNVHFASIYLTMNDEDPNSNSNFDNLYNLHLHVHSVHR